MSVELVMVRYHLILCHPLLLLPQSFPSSGSFPMSQLFASGGQSFGASASVLPMNIQGWFPLGLTGLISLLSKRLSKSLLQYYNSSINSSDLLYGPTLTSVHDYWRNHSFNYMKTRTFVCKMMSLFFNTLFEVKWSGSHSVVSDSLRPHGLYSPWNSPGQNTGVGSCSLLWEIFPTQRLNPGLPHYRWILYQLSHQGNTIHCLGLS